MASYSIIPADRSHIEPIAKRIRQADLDEMWAAAAMLPRECLLMCLDSADYARTGIIDGEPACMWGVSPKAENGNVWLITTDLIEKHVRIFLEESRREFGEMASRYGSLFNYVDARNKKAIRWLKWLTFEMGPAEPYGVFGKPFHHFHSQPGIVEEAA